MSFPSNKNTLLYFDSLCFFLNLIFLLGFLSSQVFTRYGKCYTFNAAEDGRPPLITTKGGMGNGLELMLDIQQDEYLPIWGETGEKSLF